MLILDYEKYLISKMKYTKKTIKTYIYHSKKFIEWFEINNEESVENIIENDLYEYQRYLLKIKRYEPTGVEQRMFSVLNFIRFLIIKNIINKNVIADFKILKIQKRNTSPETPTRNQLNKLKREIYKRGILRDIAIFETFINTGIRLEELLNICVNDIKISERAGSLLIREGKGRKSRYIPLNTDVRKAIQLYIENKSLKKELWFGQRGKLSEDGVRKMLKRYCENIKLNITPRDLRHYFATRLIRYKKQDILLVAELLGHTDINVTKRYTLPSLDELVEAVDNLND
jgi:site-specific recombinase XerD